MACSVVYRGKIIIKDLKAALVHRSTPAGFSFDRESNRCLLEKGKQKDF